MTSGSRTRWRSSWLALALRVVSAMAEGRTPDLGTGAAAHRRPLRGVTAGRERGRAGPRGPGARHPGAPAVRRRAAAAGLRLPPPAGVGGDHRADLGHRRGHCRRQGGHQAAARRGRHPGARGDRRAQRRGGRGCLRLPRRAGRGQAGVRPPRARTSSSRPPPRRSSPPTARPGPAAGWSWSSHTSPGRDYRVLVVGGRVAAAAELSPAQVTGDGVCAIAALVDQVNADPRRGIGHDRPLTRIVLDDVSIAHLAGQGLAPTSVPALGQIVTLRHNANLSTGGTSKDVTDSVHPAVARMCARVAAVTGLDVCGIDLRLPDISQPLVAGHASGGVHRDQRLAGPADASAPQRGQPARRGRRHRRPALPARRAVPGADRVGDRDQRQDHHRPADRAHPAPRRSSRRDDIDRRRLHRRRPCPRGRRVRPEVGRHGSRRPHRAGRRAGDRTRRDRAPRPGLRPGRRRRGHQHLQRPPGHRRHRHPGRPGQRQVTGRRGDHLPRPARAQRRRPALPRGWPSGPPSATATRWSATSASRRSTRS